MKKRSYVSCLGALAVVMTLVTTSLTGGTMAKYATEVTGSATATVAAWSFKANGEDTTMTRIDLGSTANRASYDKDTIKEGVIAPGTEGSFEIVVDGTGSEVGIDYILVISDSSSLPSNLKFTVGNDEYTLGSEMKGEIPYSASMNKTVSVKWKWPIDTPQDKNDNDYKGSTFTLNITVTGTQHTPTPTTSNP